MWNHSNYGKLQSASHVLYIIISSKPNYNLSSPIYKPTEGKLIARDFLTIRKYVLRKNSIPLN